MHYNSKLSKVNKKINFLERKLFEHSQLIDELTINFCKLEFSPTKQNRGQNTFQYYVKRNEGETIFNYFIRYYYYK